jgi:TRAP-type mannitol/chloroaromatic compound transport system permease small subunit
MDAAAVMGFAAMGAVYSFMRGVTRLNEFIGRWAAHLIFAIFLLLIAEVFLRYFFRSPTVWTNELGQLLFGAYAVLSGGYLLARRGHVNVDILYGAFPRRAQALTDVLTSVLFFAFAAVLLWQGWIFASESVAKLESSQSAWNPSIWMFKAMIPAGAALLLLQGIVKLIQDIMVAAGFELPANVAPAVAHDTREEVSKEVR